MVCWYLLPRYTIRDFAFGWQTKIGKPHLLPRPLVVTKLFCSRNELFNVCPAGQTCKVTTQKERSRSFWTYKPEYPWRLLEHRFYNHVKAAGRLWSKRSSIREVLARLQICRAEHFLGDWGRDAGRRRELWRTGDEELSTFGLSCIGGCSSSISCFCNGPKCEQLLLYYCPGL